ncbi:MAG: hypothetical protein RI932_1719 [Pseudomonadota bacterium]|jgi:hypothetical protein
MSLVVWGQKDGGPAMNRTWASSFGGLRDIHFTTGPAGLGIASDARVGKFERGALHQVAVVHEPEQGTEGLG